jgi:hypothetical protein
MKTKSILALTAAIVLLCRLATAQPQPGDVGIVPSDWDPALAGDMVMRRLINTSAPQVKGAHDAEFVCVGDRAYIVAEANDQQGGENAAWPFIYATMSIVNLKSLELEQVIDFAKSEQVMENTTLPPGACFVPRIIQKDDHTLRCYFTSEAPGKRQSQMWYRDFDLKRRDFAPTIHKAKLKPPPVRLISNHSIFMPMRSPMGSRNPPAILLASFSIHSSSLTAKLMWRLTTSAENRMHSPACLMILRPLRSSDISTNRNPNSSVNPL